MFYESSLPVRQGYPGVGYSRRFEQATTNVAYLGEANVGAAFGDPVWRISRITTDAAGSCYVEWAGGTAFFDKIWNDRAGLSYS